MVRSMPERDECPYTKTRLELTTKIVELEKEMEALCNEYEKLREDNREIKGKLDSILTIITDLRLSNGKQNDRIETLEELYEESRRGRIWAAERVFQIISPFIASLLVYLLTRR